VSGRGAIVIAGFGSSAIERKSERGITAFAHDSAIAALKDAGVSRDQIDGYIGAPWATNAGSVHAEGADEISVKTVAAAIGLRSLRFGMDLFRRYAPDMVAAAALALKSGACRYVLGLRALYNVQGRASPTVNGSRAYGYDQFTKPFGYTTAGARFAVRAQRYMARHGVDRTDLYEVVALARRNADRNPFAIWKGRALTRESYIEAPMIASPHGLYDCDMPVCGAAAFIMCRAEDLPSGATPAYVTGWSGFQTPEEVFAMSCLRPGDVTLCQFYDGFSSMVFDWLEAFGFCEEGTAWKLIRDGGADVGGRLPLNTFGGSLGEGRLHGIGHLREAYLQVAGKADGRQVAKSGPCLVQVGPYDDSAFVMLQPEPARRIHATL
jgi:acetyl-CoA acetyltransferase